MNRFKDATFALATAGLLSTQAHASEAKVESPQTTKVAAFSERDINAMFEQPDRPMQLAALSGQEMKETEGAFVNFAIGAAVGVGTYVLMASATDSPITWQGAIFHGGMGALTGGVGGQLIRMSGGGIAANVAWRPNMLAINFGAGQYRKSQGW